MSLQETPGHGKVKPQQADNLKKIGPEKDLADFLSVHLTKPYSVNMAKSQQPGSIHHRGGKNVKISLICHDQINANLTVASRGGV